MPPIKYLEAGSRLFNSGQIDLAAKYINAAQMYRDQLQADEQTMLDAYLRNLASSSPRTPRRRRSPRIQSAAAAPPDAGREDG